VCSGLLPLLGGDFPMSISTFLSIKSDKKILALKYRPLVQSRPREKERIKEKYHYKYFTIRGNFTS
jgi:hypothetical protein